MRSIVRGYGATVARLTPDQTVGRSNRSGLIFILCVSIDSAQKCKIPPPGFEPGSQE